MAAPMMASPCQPLFLMSVISALLRGGINYRDRRRTHLQHQLPAAGGSVGGTTPTASSATAPPATAWTRSMWPGWAVMRKAWHWVRIIPVRFFRAGQLMCWGRNQHGQLGNGATDDSLVPTYAALPDVSVIQVAVGDNHTCALTEDGRVLCWGANDYGQLGDGTTDENPTPVTAIASGVSGIALGGSTQLCS